MGPKAALGRKGTALQAAEKLLFVKGTAYLAAASIRPYITVSEMNSAFVAEGYALDFISTEITRGQHDTVTVSLLG